MKKITMISFEPHGALSLSGECQEVRLLWQLGSWVRRNGCRRDFDLSVTDMYLRGEMKSDDCALLREALGPEGARGREIEILDKLIVNYESKNSENNR